MVAFNHPRQRTDYPIFPAFREATATVIKRKDELAVLPASTNRSLWRQLAGFGQASSKRGWDERSPG
jgi:hypothetical protein